MQTSTPFEIFLVDDEPFCLGVYRQYLENLGQKNIREFVCSADCLEQLDQLPDLIFLDYNMDAPNGLETLKKIKRFDPNALVVFISGQEDIDVAVDSLKHGALDYIMKSQVSEERLEQVLEKAARLRELLKASSQRSWMNRLMGGLNILLLPLLVLPLLLGSCKTQNLFQSGAAVSGDDSIFRAVSEDYQYRIRNDDKISISIWDHDELSVGSLYGIYNSNEVYGKWLLVDAGGRVNAPRIGAVNVRGLTVPAAEDSLRDRYARWIRDPVVDVKVLNKEVTLLGELKSPGKQLLEKDDNRLVDLIGKAGDFDFYANKRAVQIIRVVGNRPAVMRVDLTRMDRYMASNIRIIPGDVIYVPSKRGKDFEKRLSTILPLVSMVTGFAIVYKAFF